MYYSEVPHLLAENLILSKTQIQLCYLHSSSLILSDLSFYMSEVCDLYIYALFIVET